MSTNSTITVRTASNERKSIYCHWDGYPSNNGLILLEHYNTKERAKALVSVGWLSSLHENIEQPKGQEHTFEKPYKDVCIFYNRDRDEENCEPHVLKNSDSVDRQEFNYYFDGKKWYVNGKLLTLDLCKD